MYLPNIEVKFVVSLSTYNRNVNLSRSVFGVRSFTVGIIVYETEPHNTSFVA